MNDDIKIVDNNLKLELRKHALTNVPKECCGFILGAPPHFEEPEIWPCDNLSNVPEKSFEISPQKHLMAINTGRLIAYYHSHPEGPAEFSESDKHHSEVVGLASFLYSLKEDKLSYYCPKSLETPLEGRNFTMHVHDCLTLVLDYYKVHLGIDLEYVEHTKDDLQAGFPLQDALLAQNGLRQVNERRRHDIVVMALNDFGLPNHFAIYLGDGRILHQLMNRDSQKQVYGGFWRKNTILVLRHKNLV
jgi:proteasome lid subunit RPN8/RPN11